MICIYKFKSMNSNQQPVYKCYMFKDEIEKGTYSSACSSPWSYFFSTTDTTVLLDTKSGNKNGKKYKDV